jgi:hypothetical protein
MLPGIVNAVAAGEVEGVVVVSTEAANRLNRFGGWCGGERSATARAHGLPNRLKRSAARSADGNTGLHGSVAPQILQGAGKRTAASESIAVRRTVKDHGVVVNREGTADAPGREAK